MSHFDRHCQIKISLKPWPDLQNLGSMIDNLNLCGKFLLKLGAGWQVYMQLSALWNLGAVVENKIHLEYGILCQLLVINKESESDG